MYDLAFTIMDLESRGQRELANAFPVRKHLGGIPLIERGGQDLYSDEMTAKTYGRLLELGIILADQGWEVILDAKFDRHFFPTNAINLAQ